jgi:hypothetical protein
VITLSEREMNTKSGRMKLRPGRTTAQARVQLDGASDFNNHRRTETYRPAAGSSRTAIVMVDGDDGSPGRAGFYYKAVRPERADGFVLVPSLGVSQRVHRSIARGAGPKPVSTHAISKLERGRRWSRGSDRSGVPNVADIVIVRGGRAGVEKEDQQERSCSLQGDGSWVTGCHHRLAAGLRTCMKCHAKKVSKLGNLLGSDRNSAQGAASKCAPEGPRILLSGR